jgi:hypothetical protein
LGTRPHDHNRHELQWIEVQVRIKVLVDDQRAGRRCQQRVPVGVGFGGHFGADIAAGAGTVLDDYRLAPFAR